MPTPLPRPIPVDTVLPVVGVSHRQDGVRHVVEGDRLRLSHERTNTHDPNALAVHHVPSGELLGYLPRDLAARLTRRTPGGVWQGLVVEVFRSETWGLRLRLGPLVSSDPARPDVGAHAPGLRHTDDGVVELDGVVIPAGSTPSDSAADEDDLEDLDPAPATSEAESEGADAVVLVFAKSGRPLGEWVGDEDGKVVVRTASGACARYPLAVVRVGA